MPSMDESFADELSSIGDPYSLAPHNSNQPHLLISHILHLHCSSESACMQALSIHSCIKCMRKHLELHPHGEGVSFWWANSLNIRLATIWTSDARSRWRSLRSSWELWHLRSMYVGLSSWEVSTHALQYCTILWRSVAQSPLLWWYLHPHVHGAPQRYLFRLCMITTESSIWNLHQVLPWEDLQVLKPLSCSVINLNLLLKLITWCCDRVWTCII
jgi:hypothetical protein